jgi:O-succinylbenzoic acid--CoA ligase
MTETAAMVVAQRPEEFAGGDRSCGHPMPHARVAIDVARQIVIGGASLFRGYFPDRRASETFTAPDFGRIDADGRVHILGRVDGAIITGGKKVDAAEVERSLRASGEFDDVVVVGAPDAEWGEVVVACYPESPRTPDLARATANLAAHQRPKRFVALRDWPRNAQGKINRAELIARLNQV